MAEPRSTFDIDKVFQYHAPHGDQQQRYENIRTAARGFARIVSKSV